MDLAGKKVLIVYGQYHTKYGQCDTTYTFTANFLKLSLSLWTLAAAASTATASIREYVGRPPSVTLRIAKQRRMKVNFRYSSPTILLASPLSLLILTRRREIRH